MRVRNKHEERQKDQVGNVTRTKGPKNTPCCHKNTKDHQKVKL